MFEEPSKKLYIENMYNTIAGYQKDLQFSVDEFLKNKDNSLEDRWEVWTKYSQKNHDTFYHTFMSEDFPGLDITKFSNWAEGADGWPSRYQVVDYGWLVDQFSNYHESTDLLKEYLMKVNLGSYTIDW